MDENLYFHDTVLDLIPYTELPEMILLDRKQLGDQKAATELRRRAAEKVKRMIN